MPPVIIILVGIAHSLNNIKDKIYISFDYK